MSIRFAVLLSLLATVKGAVLLGPEVPVAPPVLAEANGAQYNAVIASASGDSLAAWFDQDRLGLYVTTIADDGTVVAPARRIYSGGASGIALCWTGTTYLITWFDSDTLGVLAMPLARDGAPTGAARLIAPGQTSTHTGALAWNGQHAFLAYYTSNSSSAVILDAQANVIRSDIALPNTPSGKSVVAAVGSTFHLFVRTLVIVPVSILVNRYEESISVVRFAGDGTPIDTSPTVVSSTGVSSQRGSTAARVRRDGSPARSDGDTGSRRALHDLHRQPVAGLSLPGTFARGLGRNRGRQCE